MFNVRHNETNCYIFSLSRSQILKKVKAIYNIKWREQKQENYHQLLRERERESISSLFITRFCLWFNFLQASCLLVPFYGCLFLPCFSNLQKKYSNSFYNINKYKKICSMLYEMKPIAMLFYILHQFIKLSQSLIDNIKRREHWLMLEEN